MSLRVRYYGPFAMKTGFSRAMNDYLCALESVGCELDIRVLGSEADTENLEEHYQHLANYCSELLPDNNPRQAKDWPEVVIVHAPPRWCHEFVTTDLAPPSGVKRVALTVWETNKLPQEDAQHLKEHFDLVVVPTEFNRSSFIEAGIPYEQLAVVPHAYSQVVWGRELPPQPKHGAYVFYAALAWVERKNPIGLLKAYLTEFTSKDDVVLRILTPDKDSTKHDVACLIRSIGLTDLPRVEFITQRLSGDELLAFHGTAHCYVSLTRGEGWNLGTFEAALVGNPVISTNWSGQREYLKDYAGFHPVGFQFTPAISPEQVLQEPLKFAGLTITPVGRIAPLGIAGDQYWAEPDLRQAKGLMREAYARRLGRGKPLGESRFTYESVGKSFLEALER